MFDCSYDIDEMGLMYEGEWAGWGVICTANINVIGYHDLTPIGILSLSSRLDLRHVLR